MNSMLTNFIPCCAEERILRQEFQVEHGQYIPEDFCLHVENLPNRWTVTTWNDEPLETLPTIVDDVVEEVSTHNACLGKDLRND